MAADQRKKRLHASSTIDYCQERDGLKKKKQGSARYDLKIRFNISLIWDDKKRCVLAKREQIGISQRDLAPFLDSISHSHDILADVFTLPHEIFELENLSEVLSHKVWQENLSENERSFLTQFLPEGCEPEEIVRNLLGEENFHFGNPFLKWGQMICSGSFHPDNVIRWEQFFKANKKAYYAELENYHDNMIGKLLSWKENLERGNDPEEEMVERIWRLRKHVQKNIPTIESDIHGFEENLVMTPESSSRYDKGCSNESLYELTTHVDPQRGKGFTEGKYGSSLDGSKVIARPSKGEKLNKRNIQHTNGARYMSYIKVSREHYQRVKNSMKHNSNSIQPRFLSNVLGDMENLHVQPFEVFEEEECQKLHDHWMHLVNRDLPVGFENWMKRRSQECQVRKSIGNEMEQKLKAKIKREDKNSSTGIFAEPPDNKEAEVSYEKSEEAEVAFQMKVEAGQHEGREQSDGLIQKQMEREIVNNEVSSHSQDQYGGESANILDEQTHDDTAIIEDDNGSLPVPLQNQHLPHVVSLDDTNLLGPIKADPHENYVQQTDEVSPAVSEYSERLNNVDVPVDQGNPLASTGDEWPAVSMAASYGCSTPVGHGFSATKELSLGHQRVIGESAASLVNLAVQKDAGSDMLPRETNDVALFGSYLPQNRNDIFQPFFKGPDSSPYILEQKQQLDFPPSTNLMVEPGQCSAGHFREQVHGQLPMELRHKGLNDLFMQQNLQRNFYPDGGRYAFAGQEQLNVSMQDWAVNSVCASAPSQSHLNSGDILSQNWFAGENQARGAWSSLEGMVGPSQSIGRLNNSDQSLFTVLSECNELHRTGSYDPSGSRDQFIPSRNYGEMGVGVTTTSNVLQQSGKPLSYLSGQESSGGLKPGGLGWASMSTQNHGLQDSMSKQFLRSWNP